MVVRERCACGNASGQHSFVCVSGNAILNSSLTGSFVECCSLRVQDYIYCGVASLKMRRTKSDDMTGRAVSYDIDCSQSQGSDTAAGFVAR